MGMSAKISATIIDGKTIAADLRAAVKAETQRLRAAHGILPGLAVVLVGNDPASQSYVASKSRAWASRWHQRANNMCGRERVQELCVQNRGFD